MKMNDRTKMKTKTKVSTPRLPRGARIELNALALNPQRENGEGNFEELKERLVGRLLNTAPETDLHLAIRSAAHEAASAAWFTQFPLLFFPALLEEKAEKAKLQQERQREIRERTQGLLEQAISE